MWNRILEKKKLIIAAIVALILAVAGVNLSQEQQDTIVDTVSGVLPNAAAPAPVEGVKLSP